MTTFYLIRHAERIGAQDALVGRAPGFSLSERGRAQAQRVADWLAGKKIDHVYTSPVTRAVETAAAIATAAGVPVQTDDDLHEVNFGEWTGKTFGELEADAAWKRFNLLRGPARAPDGETLVEVQMRMVSALYRLNEAHPNHGVVVVSHADPLKAALAFFSGIPLALFDRLEVGLASVSVLRLDGWNLRIECVNTQVAAEDQM